MTPNVTNRTTPHALSSWHIPSDIRLVRRRAGPVLDFKSFSEGRLTEAQLRGLSRSANDHGILEAFLDLHRGDEAAAVAFARKYGPLHLDSDGLPSGSRLTDQNRIPPSHRFEAIHRFVFYSKVAQAILDATRELRRDRGIPSAAWDPLLELWREINARRLQPWMVDLIAPIMSWRRPHEDEPKALLPPAASETLVVSNTVNWWLRSSWLGHRLEWTRAGTDWMIASWRQALSEDTRGKERVTHSDIKIGRLLKTEIEGGAPQRLALTLQGSGAWGALGVRLAEAVLGLSTVSEAQCAFQEPGCRNWFPVNRAPQRGRRACCGQPACLAAAAAARQRDHRAPRRTSR